MENGKIKDSKLSDLLKTQLRKAEIQEYDTLLGLPLQRFNIFATAIEGICPGLVLVAGETSSGKTAFLCNIALDLLMSSETSKVIFLTFDDHKKVLLDKLVSIQTYLSFNKENNESMVTFEKIRNTICINKLKKKLTDKREIESRNIAYQQLINWADNCRLEVKDMSDLSNGVEIDHYIAQETENSKSEGYDIFVVIDALYNIDVGNKYKGIREENIGRAQFLKKLSDRYSLPIWTSAEIRKRIVNSGSKRDMLNSNPTTDDILETSKFGYNATIVFTLYAKNKSKYRTDISPVIVLDTQKNKQSGSNEVFHFKFIKSIGIIEPVELSFSQNISPMNYSMTDSFDKDEGWGDLSGDEK